MPFTTCELLINMFIDHCAILLCPSNVTCAEVYGGNDCGFRLEHRDNDPGLPTRGPIFPDFAFYALHENCVLFQKHVLAVIVVLFPGEADHRGLKIISINLEIMDIFSPIFHEGRGAADGSDHHV